MRFRRTKVAPLPTLSWCETSLATTWSSQHLRVVGPEGPRLHGGAPGAALCGRDLRFGWDLRSASLESIRKARTMLSGLPGSPCRKCVDAAWDRLVEGWRTSG